MACTQGNGICRSCFCKSHFSRRAFLCPSVLPVAADDLPVVSGRLYPRRTGRLSGLFIRQEAPYRLKITLTGKNQVAFRAALGSPRRFQASSRPATLRMRRPAAGPSLFQIPTFFRPLQSPAPHRFSGTPCAFRASITIFMRPRLYFLPLLGIMRLFSKPRPALPDAPHFQASAPRTPQALSSPYYAEGIPGSSAPTLCTLPRSGFVIGFAVLRPNFCFAFYAWPADCPFKSNVVRCNCLPARLQNTVLHAGNLPLCMAIQRQRSAILAAKPLLNICMRPTWGRLQIPACNSMFHVKQRRTPRAHRQHFCKA